MTLSELLYGSESMAWSFADENAGPEQVIRIALAYTAKIEALIVSLGSVQPGLNSLGNPRFR
jgi:hypothetical protein